MTHKVVDSEIFVVVIPFSKEHLARHVIKEIEEKLGYNGWIYVEQFDGDRGTKLR